MKKILFVGALALLATVSAEQPASAWLNFKFGAGVNWAWQSGGNNFFWGLFRNGQPPGFGQQYDPSMLCNPQCGLQGPGPYGMAQCAPYMMQPGYCPPAALQQGPMLPQQCPTGQTQGQFPYFPGHYPYSSDQFQYFGTAPAQPASGNAADANAQAAATQNNSWHTSGYTPNPSQNWSSPYRPSSYYPYSYYPGSTSYYPARPYYSQSYYGYGYRP